MNIINQNKQLFDSLIPDDNISLWVVNPPHKSHAYYCSGTKQQVFEKVLKALGHKEIKIEKDYGWHVSLKILTNEKWLPLYIGKHASNLEGIVNELKWAYSEN